MVSKLSGVKKMPDNSEVIKTIKEFVSAVKYFRIYPHNHPQIQLTVDMLFRDISNYLGNNPELMLVVADDNIFIHGKPLLNAGLIGQSFIDILEKKGIERVSFIRGLTKTQLTQFLNDLGTPSENLIKAGSHIKLGRIMLDNADDVEDYHNKVRTEIKELYYEMYDRKGIDALRVKALVGDYLQLFNKSENPLKMIASIRAEDEYTYAHITNVSLLTISFANHLGFSGKTLEDIGVAALLHDVGKVTIPDEILKKPGPLNETERAIMETHTIKGAQLIGRQESISRLTMVAALEHHIKYDGTGYPVIKKNWQPNLVSQIISIADVYDALRSKRPYKEPISQPEIISILNKDGGKMFNPDLVNRFIAMIEQ